MTHSPVHSCGNAHRKWCSSWHAWVVAEYRAARDSWEQRREDTHHHQLEDDDYRAMYPPPTFRAWLEATAGMNAQPE